MSTLRDQILTSEDITAEEIPIPEWGGAVIEIRTMTAAKRTEFMGQAVDMETGRFNFGRLYSSIVIASTYDPETGELIFTENDEQALSEKNGAVMERIAQKAMEMSGLDDKSVDTEGKGSSNDPTSDTSSS